MENIHSNIVLGFFARTGFEVQSLLLVRSLRAFGEEMANLPVWVFHPQQHPLSPSAQEKLYALNAELLPFEVDDAFLQFPFAGKAAAAAAAEGKAEGQNVMLGWHDRTGMIKHAPNAFHLANEKIIGFRPTDIANIGAPIDQTLPPFWTEICAQFETNDEDLPPITTCIDHRTCYLYVNAGLLVVRPFRGILRKWSAALQNTYALPKFRAFYQESQDYAIFMHQAVLSAVVAKNTDESERIILPEHYLFSVDNFFDYRPENRPEILDKIITGRFHDFFALENWEEKIIASDKLIGWFHDQLKEGPYWPEAFK